MSPLHLYRHLLRETSYLPPLCQPFVKARINERFRWTQRSEAIATLRLQKGHKELRRLRAANTGDMDRILTIMRHSCGRLGLRRKQLLIKSVLSPDAPPDVDALESVIVEQKLGPEAAIEAKIREINRIRPHPKRRVRFSEKSKFLLKWDFQKTMEFLKSQKSQQATALSWPKADISSLNIFSQIPAENAWFRPTPANVVRKRFRVWWKNAVDKILPPVGRDEWELLRALASGQGAGQEWKVPLRRPAARPLHDKEEMEGSATKSSWHRLVSEPMRLLDRERLASLRLNGEVNAGPHTPRTWKAARGHSKRAWRRIYRKLWENTAYVEQNPETLKTKIVWGQTVSKFSIPTASPSQMAVFGGVDSKGQPICKARPEG
jgi:hypothetical protein